LTTPLLLLLLLLLLLVSFSVSSPLLKTTDVRSSKSKWF
jgi:hypothetical protein